MTTLQVWPALDAATEAALRASIERFGVLVPVTRDQDGRVIDGHHRARLAGELGVDCPETVREVADEDEARELARTLNADRRQLTREQRRANAIVLREQGHSQRAIGNALGVRQSTVSRDLASGDAPASPETVEGLDGKTYPLKKAKPKSNGTVGKRGSRTVSRDKPFEVDTPRKQILAAKQFERISVGLSEINGLLTGLRDVDVLMAAAAEGADLRVWTKKATGLGRELHSFATRLKEAVENGG